LTFLIELLQVLFSLPFLLIIAMKGEGLVESVIMMYRENSSQNSPKRIENKIGTF
jgi:hypothetical protein